jgi:2'-hydroxyisoflavone reductase
MYRREFIKFSSVAAMGAFSPLSVIRSLAAVAPKRLLVLGGTSFLGPAIVETAIAEGHTVTLFNRGLTNPELFPNVEKLRGHRSSDAADEDLSALEHRHFDVAIDVWPNDPALAQSAARFLKERVGHYVYVSSVAVYDSKELSRPGCDETTGLLSWNGVGRSYNRGKAESERRLKAILGEKLTIVRPGPIKGARDDGTDLLAWLVRAQTGGDHIGPGDGTDPVELVDVKDVARFVLLAIDRALFDVFNLTGRVMQFREFLGRCNTATRSDAKFVWIPRDFLHGQGLEPDDVLGTFAGNFPLWRPPGSNPGLFEISSEKAFRAGWQTRPFEETAFDCLFSFRSMGEHLVWSDYLSARKEKQVLDAWAARRS